MDKGSLRLVPDSPRAGAPDVHGGRRLRRWAAVKCSALWRFSGPPAFEQGHRIPAQGTSVRSDATRWVQFIDRNPATVVETPEMGQEEYALRMNRPARQQSRNDTH